MTLRTLVISLSEATNMNSLRLAGRVAYQIGLFPVRLRENIWAAAVGDVGSGPDEDDIYSDGEYRDVLTWKEQLEIAAAFAQEQEDAAFVPCLPGAFVDDDNHETQVGMNEVGSENGLSRESRKDGDRLRRSRNITRTDRRVQKGIVLVRCRHCCCHQRFNEDEGYDADTETGGRRQR